MIGARARGAPRLARRPATPQRRSAAGRADRCGMDARIWRASRVRWLRWRKSSRLDVQLGPGGSRVFERARRQTTHRKTERARERERTTDSQTERERQRDRERERERERDRERDRETESHSKDVCACARARQAAAGGGVRGATSEIRQD